MGSFRAWAWHRLQALVMEDSLAQHQDFCKDTTESVRRPASTQVIFVSDLATHALWGRVHMSTARQA
eukprot:5918864-Amphidinium_carterae.1